MEFLPLLEQRACRILQPDTGHMGGITGLKRLARIADDYYLTIAPHCCWGPIRSMASAHVCTTIPNLLIQENTKVGSNVYGETVVGGYEFDPQYIDIPKAPAIGIHLWPEFIKEHKIDPAERGVEWLKERAAL